ncbi:MAG: DUF6429 family protein [Clostridiales bacterium]
MSDQDEKIKELTFMLMYLTSWEESFSSGTRRKASKPDEPTWRTCWKGYDFAVLDELTDDGLVNAKGRARSATFTDEGIARAQELLKEV